MHRKGKSGLILVLVFLITILSAVPVSASRHVDVNVNGAAVKFDVPPVIRDGRTFLPLRRVAEMLGAAVEYRESDRRVSVMSGDLTALLWIDDRRSLVNGSEVQLDVAPFVIEGRTMVPLRFLAETLHFIVDWDEVTRTVWLSAPGAVAPTRIVLQTTTPRVRVGETIVVEVLLKRARAAYTAVVNLAFDGPAQGTEIVPGQIIEGLTAAQVISNSRRRVDYAVSRVGQVRGFSGDGLLYTVKFRATAAGELRVVPLEDSMVIDSGLDPLQIVRNGVVVIIEP